MMRTVSDPVHPDEKVNEQLLNPLSLADVQSDYPEVLDLLLTTYTLKNRNEYRGAKATEAEVAATIEAARKAKAEKEESQGLDVFASQGLEEEFESVSTPDISPVTAEAERGRVIFAVDDYAETIEDTAEADSNSENRANTAVDAIPHDFDFNRIIPRSQKAKEAQKRRVKEKAEVFTPTWVCNVQNNLVDDETVGKGAFNVASADNEKEWIPTSEKVFDDVVKAVDYIHSNRLEITCGEAPYLMSSYDTVTGEYLPVRDKQGRFQRIGLLDRKLRVVTESFGDDQNLWLSLAYGAFCSTYGYEWQGDNLLLARLNLLNTYRDYHQDAWGEEPKYEDLHQIAVIISMNVWQMDGLRAVVPLSAGENRGLGIKEVLPDSLTGYYDGIVPVICFAHGTAPERVAAGTVNIDNALNGGDDNTDFPKWIPFEELMGEFLQSKAPKGKKKNGGRAKA